MAKFEGAIKILWLELKLGILFAITFALRSAATLIDAFNAWASENIPLIGGLFGFLGKLSKPIASVATVANIAIGVLMVGILVWKLVKALIAAIKRKKMKNSLKVIKNAKPEEATVSEKDNQVSEMQLFG